jgi:hypothetical protein
MRRLLLKLAERYVARHRREVAFDHEAADAEIVEWLRARFPDAPEDPAEWDRWPIRSTATVSGDRPSVAGPANGGAP